MNSRMTVLCAVWIFVLLSGFCCQTVPAASGILDPNDRYENDALPAEVVKAINVPKRVYAYLWDLGWLNAQFQHRLYFKGETWQLNDMLVSLAGLVKTKDSELNASIISAPGRETRRASQIDQKRELAFDWTVKIEQIDFYSLDETKPYEQDGVNVCFEAKRARTAWRIGVDIYVEGEIDLGKLRLPLAYAASTGGRATDFADLHNRRRRAFVAGELSDLDSHPTTLGTLTDVQWRAGNSNAKNAPRPARDMSEAMAQLVGLGSYASYWTTLSEDNIAYAALKQAFLTKGTDVDFRKMFQCDKVIVRAMAMDCILQDRGAKAIPLLKSRLAGRAVFRSQSFDQGRRVTGVTEGQYARQLLMDAFVQRQAPTTQGAPDDANASPLSDKERFAMKLDLEVLSRNDTAAMHEAAREHIAEMIHIDGLFRPVGITGRITLDLRTLNELARPLSEAAIIKAIGRVKSDRNGVEEFLIKCLNDASLSAAARLAAASALTRYADPEARKASKDNKDALDKLQAGAGTKIWNAFQIREQYEKTIAPFRDRDNPDLQRQQAAAELALRTYEHPMVWGLLSNLAHSSLVNKQASTKGILKVSGLLAGQVEPWNTYGDVPYLCELDLKAERLMEAEGAEGVRHGLVFQPPYVPSIKGNLSDKDYKRLVDNVRAAIEAEQKTIGQ